MAKKTQIALLINSLYFFIECVFIIVGEENFRLIAIHHDQLVTDQTHKTLRGAKVSFARSFRPHPWQKKMTPQWSHIYPPDNDWLEHKWNILAQPGSDLDAARFN
jgi:hypothetical protein